MVFMAGDNNLSAAGDADRLEMRKVGSTEQVNVLLEFDNAGNRGTRRYHVQRLGRRENVIRLGETDSGDPKVLIDFVRWAVDNFPAQRYALVLWNHGGGWAPDEIDRISRRLNPSAPAPGTGSQAMRRARRLFFRTTLEKVLSPLAVDETAILSDDLSGHSLDTIELGGVLKVIAERIGAPLDLLGMDACLMSNLEVAYQLRPYVRYMVASEEEEPNQGWPYGDILASLVTDPEMPTTGLAAHIVTHYIQSYLDLGYEGDVTQAALDLARIDLLAGPLDNLAEALRQRLPDIAFHIWNAQRQSMRFLDNTLWDIGHFCEALEAEVGIPEVAQAAASVRLALLPGEERIVVAESHRGPNVARCAGVSVYLPAQASVSRYYAGLDFARERRWAAMLKKYRE